MGRDQQTQLNQCRSSRGFVTYVPDGVCVFGPTPCTHSTACMSSIARDELGSQHTASSVPLHPCTSHALHITTQHHG